MVYTEISHIIFPRSIIIGLHDVLVESLNLFKFQVLLKLSQSVQKNEKRCECQKEHGKKGSYRDYNILLRHERFQDARIGCTNTFGNLKCIFSHLYRSFITNHNMANSEHVKILDQGIPAWNAWRVEQPSIHPDLSGIDLTGRNLDGINLARANLQGTFLTVTEMEEANLDDANLSGANLTGADLSGASLKRATLSGVDLSYATLTNADLCDAVLSETRLVETILFNATMRGVSLRDAYLKRTILTGADLTGADMSGSRIRNAILEGAILPINIPIDSGDHGENQ